MTQPERISDRDKADLIRLASEGQQLSALVLAHATAARRRDGSDPAVRNALEFVALFQFELNCCLKTSAQAEPGLEANVHARHLLLTIYESLLTMRRLLAKEFRAQLVAAVGEPALDQRLKNLHRAVNELFERVNSRFGEVRDGLAAHRDPDPEVRLGLLQRVDVVEVGLLANDTLGVLTNFTQEITGHAGLLSAHDRPAELLHDLTPARQSPAG